MPDRRRTNIDREPLRVGLIGYGSVGQVVAQAILAGEIDGVTLYGVASLEPITETRVVHCDVAQLVEHCDLIVEAAGQQVVREHGLEIVRSGADFLVLSVGAMVDQKFGRELLGAGPGRVFFSTGAIGGLDLLTAARRLGAFDRVRLTTTKKSTTLIQPWMDAETVERLQTDTAPFDVYSGTARDVPTKFPRSTNVAASLAVALQMWDEIEVVVRADPDTPTSRHVIDAQGPYGSYHFEIQTVPDETNPATAKVVPHAVLRSIAKLARVSNQVI